MKTKIYSVFPGIECRSVWRPSREKNPVLDRKRFFLYASGRAALYHGVSCLPRQSGKKILVPCYHCGVEVEAIVRAGYEVVFYPLRHYLEPDFSWLKQHITREETAAILVVHYFGFPQPLDRVARLTREKEVFLIEDCAHALYSYDGESLLGSFGDISIFSLMKTVGLPNGGGLLLNSRVLGTPARGRSYINLALLKKTVRSILEVELNRRFRGKRTLKGPGRRLVTEHDATTGDGNVGVTVSRGYYEVPEYHYSHSMFFLSRLFVRPAPVTEIISRRRKNYNYLLKHLDWSSVMRPLFGPLGPGVCPLCLPVLVDNSDTWCKMLARNRLFPFVFGRFSHPLLVEDDFPGIQNFQRQIMGLPVHQQLEYEDMQEIVARINRVSKEIHG